MEVVITEMTQGGALDDLLERLLKELTKSLTFMEAFTNLTITSSRFVCTVAKFICAEIEKETYDYDNIRKGHNLLLSSQPTSSSV